MMNTEFWVALGEAVAIIIGIVEEVIRNIVLKRKKKKKYVEEESDVEVTLTEKPGGERGENEEEKTLKISIVKKEEKDNSK